MFTGPHRTKVPIRVLDIRTSLFWSLTERQIGGSKRDEGVARIGFARRGMLRSLCVLAQRAKQGNVGQSVATHPYLDLNPQLPRKRTDVIILPSSRSPQVDVYRGNLNPRCE